LLDSITPLILTRDEEPNIGRTLAQLAWAQRVVIVDSGSTDRTLAIARTFPNVVIAERALDTLAEQWSFALAQAATEWVLTLDADYFVPDRFTHELASLVPPLDVAGYEARFDYAIGGRRLRASVYTPRVVLLRRSAAQFWQDGHTQRVRVNGRVVPLMEPLVHDDRKPFSRFLARQRRYMRDEAAKLRATPWSRLNTAGRIRKLRFVAPLAVVAHTLLSKRLILDGRAGLHYAWERFVAEVILARELFRRGR
jgi:glycosyltransferase involved in cell wall biosynthesis